MMSDQKARRLAVLMKVRHLEGERPYALLLGSAMTFSVDVISKIAGRPDRTRMYQTLRGLSQDERYAVLSSAWRDRPIPSAYRHLGKMIKLGYFDVVLTTDPSNQLETALIAADIPLGQFDVILPVRDHQIQERMTRSPRIKIVKLRGDLRSRTLASFLPEEALQLNPATETVLRAFLDRDSIVVGLAPEDHDIGRYLRVSDGSFAHFPRTD